MSKALPSTARRVGCKARREPTLVTDVISGLHRKSDAKTKEWFTNYVKGTTWVGCKVPTVRKVVKEVYSQMDHESSTVIDLLDPAVELLQQPECDVKLAGMLLLSEMMPPGQLATKTTLQRLQDDVLMRNCLQDWSSADWFATKVLRKMVFSGDHALVEQVLNFGTIPDTSEQNYTFVRRCGVVSFLFYEKHRDKLPLQFGSRLIQACEQTLVLSPNERFTQTGVAWVLRTVLIQLEEESKEAFEMILRQGPLWTMEAKRSLVEKLPTSDRRRSHILKLGKS